MSTQVITFIISGSGFVLSLVTSVGIVFLYMGRMQERISNLREQVAQAATKTELTALHDDITDIKNMLQGAFKLTLRDG